MKKLYVKSRYKDMVAIRDKYLEEIQEVGVRICHDDRYMDIHADDVADSIVMISKQVFASKYEHDVYRLVYFKWLPTSPLQSKLLDV